MPAETLVYLGGVGALAGARRPEVRAEDTEHRGPAFGCRTGALLRHAVHGARLLVQLQP